MKRNDWSELAVFATIAEEGGFTRAAARLGVSPSALSHAMRALEARVGVRLLNRTTRSTAPTAAGEQLLERVRPAMREVEGAMEALNAQRDRPAGRVRISAHRTAATAAILPRLSAFADAYPEIEVELVAEDGLVDIVAGRFDAGVRTEGMLAQDMISVPIGPAEATAIVATPAYFDRFGRPGEPQDLMRHRCLNYRYTTSGTVHPWGFLRDGQAFDLATPGWLTSNAVDVILEAALQGVGVANLPGSDVRRHVAAGVLERVLESWCAPIPPNRLYYSSRRQSTAAFTAFVEFMRLRGS